MISVQCEADIHHALLTDFVRYIHSECIRLHVSFIIHIQPAVLTFVLITYDSILKQGMEI